MSANEVSQQADAGVRSTAFAALYRREYQRIFCYVMRRSRTRGEAEDVVPETFTRAMRDFARLEPSEEGQRAWLYRTATNLLHDAFRRRRRHPLTDLDSAAADHQTAALIAWGDGNGAAGDISERLATLQRYRQALALVERLRPKYQDVLLLHFVEERSLAEVARILGVREGTVKWRLHVALSRLNHLLEKRERWQQGAAT